ncbi:MAG: NAD(P)-dependent oxidoreductase [Betaproteobacteria bacterium]|nr:NAD(P)-dependent oxidoreductase [Betaproteobacteria bacterium]
MEFTILGAGGFIGNQLVKSLKTKKENNVYAPQRHNITNDLNKILARDLGHVFYCIGLTANFREHPFNTVDAHICILKRILEHGQFESLTYLSSTRVYEGSDSTHESNFLQVSPNNPGHLYNLSKLTGEALCLSSGLKTKIARLSNVFGQAMRPKNFIHQILQEAASRGKVHFLTAPQSAKDYVSVHDIIRWLPQIAIQGKHNIYNVASGKNTSNTDIAVLLKENGVAVSYAEDAPEWSFPVIDTNRLTQEFGHTQSNFSSEFNDLYRYYSQSH